MTIGYEFFGMTKAARLLIEGTSVARHSWFDVAPHYRGCLIYVPETKSDIGLTYSAYFGFVSGRIDDLKVDPWTPTLDDLVANDWMVYDLTLLTGK